MHTLQIDKNIEKFEYSQSKVVAIRWTFRDEQAWIDPEFWNIDFDTNLNC
jgi:hypothetical protein